MTSADAPPLFLFDEVDSTQRVARALITEGAVNGACVAARVQTAGRGRRGRTWLNADDDGVLLSMVHYPRCAPKDAGLVPLVAAVAVLDALESLGVRARVKWPNDLLLPRDDGPHGKIGPFRKIAGVLAEAVTMTPASLEACVVGVGVNVRAPRGGWPEEVALTAGALADAGFAGSVDDVREAVRGALLTALPQGGHDFAHALARARTESATLGRRVEVDGVVGVARSIDDDGALVIVDDAGVVHTLRSGDVSAP